MHSRRSIWRKLARIGRALGGGMGLAFDRIAGLFRTDRSVAFTIGLIALSAKMARADGVVTQDEVAAFHRVADFPASEEANVHRLFDLAKKDTAGFETYAARLGSLFADDKPFLADVLDGLFVIAAADGVVHEKEDAYLSRVAELFGLSRREYEHVRAFHVKPEAGDPYLVLGVERGASDEEIRRAWLKQLAENHPDVLLRHGVPPEFLQLANERTAAINAAWDRIKRERGLR